MRSSRARSPLRALVCALVEASPGVSIRALAGAAGVNESTVSHHLRMLQREGRVSCEVQGRERVWFGAGHGLCPVLRRAIPLFRREGARAVALALDGDPATAPQISMRSGVAERAVRTACAQLERAGVAERTGAGRALLREGADVCVGRAARGVACGLWGECLVSRAWLARLEVGRGEAVERLPASAFPSRGEA